MAAKTQITNKGLELMASSSKATGQHWWIGWYALAFVPDELQENEDEQLKPGMTKLTKDGDIIYNIFQGDMNGDGYQTTKASNKFKSVNYDSNIKKNYRYVLDEDGRNNLVTWVDGKYGLKGAYIYQGVKVNASRDDDTIDYAKSLIPLPAPLLYTGVKAAGEGWSESGMDIFLGSGNDRIENFYPVDEVGEDVVPRVSTDFRNYEGYKNGLPKIEGGDAKDYAHALGETFNDVDIDGWFPSVSTYTQNDETDMGEDYNQYCYQYWKILSISNFNKYCAPVNASGLLYDENTGCRNMAKATKYFPISDYSVTSTAKTADNEYATGIKLKVQLKLNGNAEDGAYFKEVETGDDDNVATLNPSPTDEQHALFNSQKVSFKFNRIGIYAVPMRQYGCSGDSGEMKAQYQIDTEAEPVLFAVCEWDSPVTLSDSGEGLSEFQSDIFIDLSGAVDDSSVIRESAVFYNLYEDDAIDWYKNQLLANASMAEALVNMQIEMGYLRDQKNAKAGCCPKQEAIQQKEKSVTGLRNLVDAKDYNSNSVRNRLAQDEGVKLDPDYSDSIPPLGAIGYPTDSSTTKSIYARKTSVTTEGEGTRDATTNDTYSALIGEPFTTASYSDAEFDENTYVNMTPSSMVADVNSNRGGAVRIGGLWLRKRLYYELFSFQEPGNNDDVYDYPDNVATNGFYHNRPVLTDYFGTDIEGRGYNGYVTITKTASSISYDDNGTVNPGYPTELSTITEFQNEINRPIENYETQRVYIARYWGTGTRDYSGFSFKRTTTFELPIIQLYKLSTDVFSDINKRMQSTGWRIPTYDEWNAISTASKSNPEIAKAIRSSEKWSQTGGTGYVYPLGGAASGRAGTSICDITTPTIYLAIADNASKVVKFDGTTFNIIDTPSYPDTETGLSYVSILCVTDAIEVSSGTSNYKLGYDSYALMEGSIAEGSHDFNAAEKSSIFGSATYVSIFGGMYNKVSDSAYSAILNGQRNTMMNAAYSVMFGDDNIVQGYQGSGGDIRNTCGTLAAIRRSVVSGCTTSALFTDFSKIQSTFCASILSENCEIDAVHYGRVAGKYIYNENEINFSDVLGQSVYHLPYTYMSRIAAAYDDTNSLPDSLEIDSPNQIVYSNLTAHTVYFCHKVSDDYHSSMAFSRMFAGGGSSVVGIEYSHINYSDIIATGDGSSKDGRASYRTLESVSINFSRLILCHASVMSSYVDSHVSQSIFNFSDITLCDSLMLMSDSSNTHSFSFGVMRLVHSVLSQCDCSYVSLLGCEHYLTSAQLYYSTLVGQKISMSSNYIRNTHIYGSLYLPGSLDNHIILGGLDGSNVGSTPASNYISEFGSYIVSNYHGYPMIWSLGGIGMYMNKMILGDKGVSGGKAPSIGDVLTVVGVEGNLATVAWMPGGVNGKFGTIHLELVYKYQNDDGSRGCPSVYAVNPWRSLNGNANVIYVNDHEVTNTSTALNTMNSYLTGDIKFKISDGDLVLENTSGSDSYMISGTARCEVVENSINNPAGDGSSYGWQMWDTTVFIPQPLGTYAAALNTVSSVGPSGQYNDLVRSLAFGYKTSETAQGDIDGALCSMEVGALPQTLVCKWVVDITYRKV